MNCFIVKPVVLAVIELCLFEGVSQSVTQSVIRKFHLIIKKKIHSNLLKVFQVNLKVFLGLVLPNQHCLLIIVREN